MIDAGKTDAIAVIDGAHSAEAVWVLQTVRAQAFGVNAGARDGRCRFPCGVVNGGMAMTLINRASADDAISGRDDGIVR